MKLQPFSQALSLVGTGLGQSILKKAEVRQVAVSLVAALLVVMAAGFALNMVNAALVVAYQPQAQEPVAYQPGKMISAELSRGYVGQY